MKRERKLFWLIAAAALGGAGLEATGCANTATDCKLIGTCAGEGGSSSSSGTGGAGGSTSSSGGAGGSTSSSGGAGGTGGTGGGGAGPTGPCEFRQYGDTKDQAARSVAIDAQGNVLVVGELQGTIDFNGALVSTAGGPDLFVAKLDPTWKPKWAKNFAATHQASAADPSTGGVVVAGTFTAPLDFGCGPLDPAAARMFVAKLNGSGQCVWSRGFDVQSSRSSVAVGKDGVVAIGGAFQGPAFLDKALSNAGGNDAFVAALDATDGHPLFSSAYGDVADDQIHAVTFDTNGNVVVTGTFNGSISFGGGNPFKSNGNVDVFLVQIHTDGSIDANQKWHFVSAPGSSPNPTALAPTPAGTLVLAGDLDGSLDVAGTALNAQPGLFALEFAESSGMATWAQTFAGTDAQLVQGIAVDVKGTIALTGALRGTVDLGGSMLASPDAASESFFVAELDPTTGDPILGQAFGGSALGARGAGVAFDGTDLFIAGHFGDSVTFEPMSSPHDSTGGTDVFVAKLCGP